MQYMSPTSHMCASFINALLSCLLLHIYRSVLLLLDSVTFTTVAWLAWPDNVCHIIC